MERQLSLLRQSNVNPEISAYAHVYVQYDYNATPFLPINMDTLDMKIPAGDEHLPSNTEKDSP